jgi:disulfide oxidoreductase YuzD
MYNPPETLKQKSFAEKMIEEDLFYPLVLIEGEIIAEGNVRLKKVVEAMEKYGYSVRV